MCEHERDLELKFAGPLGASRRRSQRPAGMLGFNAGQTPALAIDWRVSR